MQTVQTPEFAKWLSSLKDRVAYRLITLRIARLEAGLFGDAKFFGKVGELRVNTGAGYRVYFTRRGDQLVILLCGGDKRTQQKDIAKAEIMAAQVE